MTPNINSYPARDRQTTICGHQNTEVCYINLHTYKPYKNHDHHVIVIVLNSQILVNVQELLINIMNILLDKKKCTIVLLDFS